VGTGVEEDNVTISGLLEVGDHAFEVKTHLGVDVLVGLSRNASLLEDGVVVAPGWARKMDCAASHETVDENATDTKSTGSGEGLDAGHTLLGDGATVLAEDELGGLLPEVGEARHAKVLLIEGTRLDLLKESRLKEKMK